MYLRDRTQNNDMKRFFLLIATIAVFFAADAQRQIVKKYNYWNFMDSTTFRQDAVFQGVADFDSIVNFSGDSLEINSKVTIADDSVDIHTDTACCGFVGLRVRLAGGNTAYGYYNTALARAASVVRKGANFYGTYYLLAFKLARLQSDSIAEVKAPDVRLQSSDSVLFINAPRDTVGLPSLRLWQDSNGFLRIKQD